MAIPEKLSPGLREWLVRGLAPRDVDSLLTPNDPIRAWWGTDRGVPQIEQLIDLLLGAQDHLTLLALIQRARCSTLDIPPKLDWELADYLNRIACRSRVQTVECAPHALMAYAHADHDRASLLAGMLREAGLCVFKDTDAIRPGDNILTTLTNAIALTPVAVLAITRNYLETEWTRREYQLLLDRQSVGKMRLYPVLFDEVPLPAEVVDVCTIDLRGFRDSRDLSWARERLTPLIHAIQREP